jgi:hypothetical protein
VPVWCCSASGFEPKLYKDEEIFRKAGDGWLCMLKSPAVDAFSLPLKWRGESLVHDPNRKAGISKADQAQINHLGATD